MRDFTLIKKLVNLYIMLIAEGASMVSKCCLYRWIIWICVFLLSSVLSCSKSSEDPLNPEGELFIKLIDAPVNYQEVNINVVYIAVHRIGTSEPFGWSIVSTDPIGPINLLSLRNGASKQLLLNKLPVGKYDKIKLRFGTCTIKLENGSESLLNFYTAPQFEFVLNYNFEVLEGNQAQLTFDFDVSRSVSRIGFTYWLTPAIRVQNTLLSGSIAGSVVDSNHTVVPTTISTWTGVDSASTLNDTLNGSFQLSDLPEKTYSVRIVPFDTISFYEEKIDSVVVIRQTTNNLGAIVLRRR